MLMSMNFSIKCYINADESSSIFYSLGIMCALQLGRGTVESLENGMWRHFATLDKKKIADRRVLL